MVYETIIFKKEDGIAEIVLNRPEKMNALSLKMIREIKAALEDAGSDDTISVLIITGAGIKAFTAGDDLKDEESYGGGTSWQGINSTPSEIYLGLLEKSYYTLLGVLMNLRKPVIAAVNGWCLGSGVQLALACDIIIASETSTFGLPYISMGTISGTSILPRVVGYHKACELLFTEDRFGAKEAEAMGLVNRVVPADQLQSTTRQLALKLAKKPTQLIGWTKWALNKAMNSNFKDAFDCEVLACALTHPSKYVPSLVNKRESGI